MAGTPTTHSTTIEHFGGINRSANDTGLGPVQGMAQAIDARNAVRDYNRGDLSPRRGMVRTTFSTAYTPDGRIDGMGAVTVRGVTRLFYLTSNNTLRRLSTPARAVSEADT